MNPNHQSRGLGATCAIYALSLVAGLPAQEPTEPKPEPAVTAEAVPSTADSPSVTSSSSARTSSALARITAESCRVRCFASQLSPTYEGELPKGTVIEVGEEVGEFRRVALPLGVVGYVSKRFATAPEQGRIRTSRALVSFRYRPTPKNRAEAPVETMQKDTELLYLGETEDWWRVRFVTEAAYVPIADIEVLGDEHTVEPEVVAEHDKLVQAHDAEWRNAVTELAERLAIAARDAAMQKQLTGVRTTLQAETQKALGVQDLEPIRTELKAVFDELDEQTKGDTTPLRQTAEILEAALQRQQVFIDAHRVMNAKEPAPPPTVRFEKTPKDRLHEKLHTIGWLKFDPRATGPRAFRLEKGGRVISYIYCNSLRYDLSMFDGVEIGVRGVRREDARVPYLDVRTIEVLGLPR